MLHDLERVDWVVVPTDKTNSVVTMPIHQLKLEVLAHLKSRATPTPKSSLDDIVNDCLTELNDFTPFMSKDEAEDLTSKRDISFPQVLG